MGRRNGHLRRDLILNGIVVVAARSLAEGPANTVM
jgi:hypothetical protein